MAYNDFKRYVWLVDSLSHSDGLSFAELDEIWQDAKDDNPTGEPLPVRTFYNHIKAIRNIFGIKIEMSKGDHRYRIVPDEDVYADRMQKELMSVLSLNRTVELFKGLQSRILYEKEPFIYPEWMRTIVYAMNNGQKIWLEYQSYEADKPSKKSLSPYCIKMFKRRWYLLAKGENGLRTYALDDRTKGVEVLPSKFVLPEGFDAEAQFKDAFGIRISPPKRVVLKAYGSEVNYLRSAPLHPSQKEEETGDGYAVFSLFVGIDAWEFYQEILSRGNRLEVLAPKTLREDIAKQIEEMRQRYA